MGTEYRLVIDGPVDAVEIERILRAHPCFFDFDPTYASYNFRLNGKAPPSMPHAEARIESNAIYFCDYGDDGSIFEALRVAFSVEPGAKLART